ncbi:MAG: hypothetical protein ACRDY6_10645 [Acidimicrobiia bacterium]
MIPAVSAAAGAAASVLGEPVDLEVLKRKPGRRCTWRATGPAGTAIVKAYASRRAPIVAARVAALARGPAQPLVPHLRLLDPETRVVVLDDLPGVPLRDFVIADDLAACRRAGATLAAWHHAWRHLARPLLRAHTVVDELDILRRRASATRRLRDTVIAGAARLTNPWPCSTVVHRDLYEDQLLLDGHAIAMIDVDDAALGPPELDLGNLTAHLELLAHRANSDTDAATTAILDGYRAGAPVSATRLEQCRRLALLRLACIHDLPHLAERANPA